MNQRASGLKVETGPPISADCNVSYKHISNLINYKTSHKLSMLAAPTPDHFVPVLYSLGLMEKEEEINYFYDGLASIPAFSERSFIIG